VKLPSLMALIRSLWSPLSCYNLSLSPKGRETHAWKPTFGRASELSPTLSPCGRSSSHSFHRKPAQIQHSVSARVYSLIVYFASRPHI
jgi:hypothetical protein